MAGCCGDSHSDAAATDARQRRVLGVVLGINVVLFVVEFAAGVAASSTALLADSLDMLGDAFVYGFSLYVVGRGDLWKARAATLKGWIMFGFGLFVLAQATMKFLKPEVPVATVMGFVGSLALAGNLVCLVLLTRTRNDDVNMRSVWICSRNDIVANTAVLGAGALVWLWQSQLPDLVVGLGIAALFLRSAVTVLGEARAVRDDAATAQAQSG